MQWDWLGLRDASKEMKERTCFTELENGKNQDQKAGYVTLYLVFKTSCKCSIYPSLHGK